MNGPESGRWCDACPFTSRCQVRVGEQLEAAFPNARAFVRPAFDEPDEVARLLSQDG